MTSNFYDYLSAFLIVVLIAACGSNDQQPDKQQNQQQKEQSKKDSIAQAKADSIEKARSDSLAKAKKKVKVKEKQENKLTLEDISFNSSGPFSVQVEAWRSKDKAQTQVSKWKKRGFSNAYVVKAGNEETGNVWFRVRLGRVDNKQTAQKLAKLIRQQYNEKTWISEAKGGT